MLWNKEEEKRFFIKALEISTPEKLFYITDSGRFLAYWPKDYKGKKSTLQSRNAFIGNYTEKWVKVLLKPFAEQLGVYVENDVVCEDIGISVKSPADVALVKQPGKFQLPENIVLLIEVKMSIIWNWEYNPQNNEIKCIGDYTTHQGIPGLLRSDTMLKAIGKSINIRVSGGNSSKIPIIIIGNSPISRSYYKKVDHLRKAGIVQRFYSVTPNPSDENKGNIKSTANKGFVRIDNIEELYNDLKDITTSESEFFSSFIPKEQLGKIIEKANQESSYISKAEIFPELLKNVKL